MMKYKTIAMPVLCSGLYRWPSSVVCGLLFDEILHYTHHDDKMLISEINLVDISEVRSKMLCKEFDSRDFEQGGQRKKTISELDELLADEVKVLETK